MSLTAETLGLLKDVDLKHSSPSGEANKSTIVNYPRNLANSEIIFDGTSDLRATLNGVAESSKMAVSRYDESKSLSSRITT